MLIIIYTKQPQQIEDWACENRGADKTIFVRDVRGFSPSDIEPCDQVWMTEDYPVLHKAYRPEKLKVFNPIEVKQRPRPQKRVNSKHASK